MFSRPLIDVLAAHARPLADLLALPVRPLVDLVAPPACLACRRPPRAGDPLCTDCRMALPWLGSDTCARCGLPRPCGRGRGRRCAASALAFDRAWAPVAYGGPAAALVVSLKERGAVAAASVMAGQMAALAPDGLLAGAVLVPVPADPLRARRRGIDHSALLARRLGARVGLRTVRALRRPASRDGRQAHAGRGRRLSAGRIRVELRGEAPPAVVLVDDVHTTGATLHACAQTLRSGGTHWVAAVSYARTLPTTGFGRTFSGT